MASKTSIEWTATVHADGSITPGATWNPTRGCTRVSPGCVNCYAEVMAARFSGPGQWGEGFAAMKSGDHRWTGKVALVESALTLPLRWKTPRKIFVNSTSDLFHESLSDEAIDRVFAVMALAPQHTFQVLTKRPERMLAWSAGNEDDGDAFTRIISRAPKMIEDGDRWWDFLNERGWPLPNVWLGTSVEDQERADERIPHLLATPAAVRFLSCEPLLGPIDLRHVAPTDTGYINALSSSVGPNVDWVIAGGESGPNARPMHPDWARSLRDQCAAGGVPFFFKQWGEWEGGAKTVSDRERGASQFHKGAYHDFGDDYMALRVGKKLAGALLDGVEHNGYPRAA